MQKFQQNSTGIMLFLFILKQLLFYFSFVNFNFILKLHDFAYLKVDIVFGCEFVNSI